MIARYTEVLKNLMENSQTAPLLEKALSTYPIYERKSKNEFIPNIIPTRSELNRKILNHYKYREIAFETVGRFLDELEIAMCEIMPRYNQLFFTQDQDFNIIFNVDYQRTITTGRTGTTSDTVTGTNTGSSTTDDSRTARETSQASSESSTASSTESQDSTQTSGQMENATKNVHSATPQNQLSISNKNIDSVSYADDASWNKVDSSEGGTSSGTSSGSTETSSEGSSEATSNRNESGESSTRTTGESSTQAAGQREEQENTLETTKGNFGVVSAQDLVLKYRETILNVEKMILEDERIRELFMMVF